MSTFSIPYEKRPARWRAGRWRFVFRYGSLLSGRRGGFDSFGLFDVNLGNTAGTHGICFVFHTEADEAVRFEDFSFEKTAE